MVRSAPVPAFLVLLALAASTPSGVARAEGPSVDPSVLEVIAPESAPAMTSKERSRIDSGRVVVRDLSPSDGKGLEILAMGAVDAPPAAVWEVMADCADQDEFMPRVISSLVRDRDGDDHTCELVMDLPFPLDDARTATRNHARKLPDGGFQRYWTLAPGDWSYERDIGSWSVHPLAGGERSLLVLRMDLLSKSLIPVWVLRAAQKQQAPASFEAIRERVRRSRSLGLEERTHADGR